MTFLAATVEGTSTFMKIGVMFRSIIRSAPGIKSLARSAAGQCRFIETGITRQRSTKSVESVKLPSGITKRAIIAADQLSITKTGTMFRTIIRNARGTRSIVIFAVAL